MVDVWCRAFCGLIDALFDDLGQWILGVATEETPSVEPISSAKLFALLFPITVLAIITVCMGLGAMAAFEFSIERRSNYWIIEKRIGRRK